MHMYVCGAGMYSGGNIMGSARVRPTMYSCLGMADVLDAMGIVTIFFCLVCASLMALVCASLRMSP